MSVEWQLRRPEAPIFGRPPRKQKWGKEKKKKVNVPVQSLSAYRVRSFCFAALFLFALYFRRKVVVFTSDSARDQEWQTPSFEIAIK
jgi:hypothetical protein